MLACFKNNKWRKSLNWLGAHNSPSTGLTYARIRTAGDGWISKECLYALLFFPPFFRLLLSYGGGTYVGVVLPRRKYIDSASLTELLQMVFEPEKDWCSYIRIYYQLISWELEEKGTMSHCPVVKVAKFVM